MDIEAIMQRLNEACVAVWLDGEGKLRIDKDAPADLKKLVREHKQAVTDVRSAIAVMNASGVRIVPLPNCQFVFTYSPGTELESVRWAMKVLHHESVPLLSSDHDLRSSDWDEWKLRQPVKSEPRAEPGLPAAEQAALEFSTKTT